jgi:hypothetical protein
MMAAATTVLATATASAAARGFPDPPRAGLLTRYVLENPYPAAIAFAAGGAIAIWMGLRDGRRDRVIIGSAAAAIGIIVLLLGSLVVTAGEHGRRVTKGLVGAVVAGDHAAAMSLIAADATLAIGSPNNPGVGIDVIAARIADVIKRYAIESNRISYLRAYAARESEAEVHLACWTDAGWGFVPSQWILQVRRGPGGEWKVSRITCLAISGQVPAANLRPR